MAQDSTIENIVGGPSKMDLMFSLFLETYTVSFKTRRGGGELGNYRTVNITSLKRDDSSGENWLLEGCAYNPERRSFSDNVKGSYSTACRKGTLEVEPV